jgi:hypothetical protein
VASRLKCRCVSDRATSPCRVDEIHRGKEKGPVSRA